MANGTVRRCPVGTDAREWRAGGDDGVMGRTGAEGAVGRYGFGNVAGDGTMERIAVGECGDNTGLVRSGCW